MRNPRRVSMDPRRRILLLVGLAALLIGLAPIQTPFWAYDFFDVVVQGSRPPLELFSTKAWGFYYRPLHLMLISGLHSILGPSPAAFHLVNALLLAAGTLAVYGFHRRMNSPAWTAALAALLYAAAPPTWFNLFHAVEAELMAVPILYASLLLFLYLGRAPGEGQRTRWALAGFAAMAFGGVFLKESIRGLLALGVVGLAYRPWREKRLTRAQWLAGTLAVAATILSLVASVASYPTDNFESKRFSPAELGLHVVWNLYQFTSPLLFSGVLALLLATLLITPRMGRHAPIVGVVGLLLPVATAFLLSTPLNSFTFWEALFPPLALEPLLALYALFALGSLGAITWRGEEPGRTYGLMVLLGLASTILGTGFSPTVRSQTSTRSLITFFPLLAWLVVDALRRLRAEENHRVARGAALACAVLLVYHVGASDFNVASSMDTVARAEAQVKPLFRGLDLKERYIYSTWGDPISTFELSYMLQQSPERLDVHNIGLRHPEYRLTRDRGIVTPEGIPRDRYGIQPADYIYYERWRMEAPAAACRELTGTYRNWYSMIPVEFMVADLGCHESSLNESLRENATTVGEAALPYWQFPRWLEDIPYRLHRGLPVASRFTHLVGLYQNRSAGP